MVVLPTTEIIELNFCSASFLILFSVFQLFFDVDRRNLSGKVAHGAAIPLLTSDDSSAAATLTDTLGYIHRIDQSAYTMTKTANYIIKPDLVRNPVRFSMHGGINLI